MSDEWNGGEVQSHLPIWYAQLGPERVKKIEAAFSEHHPIPKSTEDVQEFVRSCAVLDFKKALFSVASRENIKLIDDRRNNVKKLAISCMFPVATNVVAIEPSTPITGASLGELAGLLTRASAILSEITGETANMKAVASDGISPKEINEINALAPYADKIKQMLKSTLSLAMSSFMVKKDGKLILSDDEKKVTIPLSDDDIKKILDDQGLEREEVEITEVESPSNIVSFSSIPLWMDPLPAEFSWSKSCLKPKIEAFIKG